MLNQIVKEDYRTEGNAVREGIDRYKSLLLKIAKTKKFDVAIYIEGTRQEELNKYEVDLGMLERANLIKGQMKYTNHNAYRQYELTMKGAELVERLSKET